MRKMLSLMTMRQMTLKRPENFINLPDCRFNCGQGGFLCQLKFHFIFSLDIFSNRNIKIYLIEITLESKILLLPITFSIDSILKLVSSAPHFT